MRPVLSLLWKGVAVAALSVICVVPPAVAQFQTCDGGRCPSSREEPRERERRSEPRSSSSERPRTFGDQREERARGRDERPAPSAPPRTFNDNREERRERPAPTNPPRTFNDNRDERRDRDRPETRPPRPDRPPQGDRDRPRPDRPPPGWEQGQRPPPGGHGQRPPPGWNGQRPPPPGWNSHRPYPPGYDRRPRRYSDNSGLWPGIVAGALTIPFNPWPSQPSYTPRYGYAWDGTELPASAPELGDSARNAPRFQVASRSRLPALPRGYHYRLLKNWVVMVEDRSLRVAQVMMNYDRMR